MTRIDGGKSPERHGEAAAGLLRLPDGGRFLPYVKTTLTWAVRMREPFEVATVEGVMAGKAGDYLACGAAGELYPIDADVFAASYAPAPIPVPSEAVDG